MTAAGASPGPRRSRRGERVRTAIADALGRLTWSRAQRRVIVILMSLLLAYLTARAALHRRYVPDPQPPLGARSNELASRIDPNTADWNTLAALPQIGEKRAKEIVAYRERHARTNPAARAFDKPEDLMKIRGFGRAMVEHMRPYLVFPTTQPASAR